ncbi:ATP-dependent DNA helicase [Clostridium sp. MSJ-4]|uniref:ATP-dependent DNA helicase n=1 Tax=Clostridium simiarum TaxID=2841506 RepID=A0ABS6F1V2_9CLOT|nr:ATP-dependent DNA helicase [Clostridium simiarum]MBU5592470.1 ATP-dependent DNA helicase [Clostridium simiarum]
MEEREESRYFPENNIIKVSVRDLVEFVLRRGSIDSGFISSKRAQEGTKAHKKVQKANEEYYSSIDNIEYKKEVTLSHEAKYEDLSIVVQGRADGLIIEEIVEGTVLEEKELKDLFQYCLEQEEFKAEETEVEKEGIKVTIEEIKSTTRDLSLIFEDYNELHLAQAKCYAYMFLKENPRKMELSKERAYVKLVYYHIDSEEIKTFTKGFSFKELEEYFLDIIKKYHSFAAMGLKWKEVRDDSIKNVSFPFSSYRKGQRELAVAVYKTIEHEKKIFAKAPTGIGKTISTIFPAVKALGEGHLSKIFYLTAKTTTRTVAEEAFKRLRKEGLKLKSITLTAKDKICFTEDKICSEESCPYAEGHFDRVNEAIKDILTNEEDLNRETIEKYARNHKVCPFEFSLDLSLFCDAIICDYNYVFDPSASLKRFFDKELRREVSDFVLLIDEAHNMVDRAREMFSAKLLKSNILQCKKIIKGKSNGIYKALDKINSYFISLRHEIEETKDKFLVEKNPPEDLYPLIRVFMRDAEEYLMKNKNTQGFNEILDLYFQFNSFLNIGENYGEDYVTYIDYENNDVGLKLFCVDPSRSIKEVMKAVRSTVFFSATLSPMDYFKDLLGGDSEDYVIRLKSPFPKENLEVALVNNISTKYRSREQSYERIAEYIYTLADSKIGNYMIFFPSYQYMNMVLESYISLYGDKDKGNVEIIVQETSMTEENREMFLDNFKENPEKSLIAYVVLGGVFSEGIDLTGDRLSGALIVGVGLPKVCAEREIIREYYEVNKKKGFEYSYIYPGMNKVTQAAGRVIRTEEDKGIVILVDERYSYETYERLLPEEWIPYRKVSKGKQLECLIKNSLDM